jgi:uncharacterized protein YidB (DUF937 family)
MGGTSYKEITVKRIMSKITSSTFLIGGFSIAMVALLLLGYTSEASAAAAKKRPARRAASACVAVLAKDSKVNDAISDLVTNGTITQAQSDSIMEAINSNQGAGAKACQGLALFRAAGVGKAVTALLGLTGAEIRQDYAGGKSLTEIAQTKGVDRQQLINTIDAAIKTELDTLVSNGKIDSARETQIMTTVQTAVGKLVDFHKGDAKAAANGTPAAGNATPSTSIATQAFQ